MKWIISAIIFAVCAAVAYFSYFSHAASFKREAAKSLQAYAQVVASQDKPQLRAMHEQLLAPEAKITIRAQYLSITEQVPVMTLAFDTPQFITFIDGLVAKLTDTHFEPRLENFTVNDDKNTASVIFTAKLWADGQGLYGLNTVPMRHSGDARCEAQLRYVKPAVQMSAAECTLDYRSLPKPGELGKMRDAIADEVKQQLGR